MKAKKDFKENLNNGLGNGMKGVLDNENIVRKETPIHHKTQLINKNEKSNEINQIRTKEPLQPFDTRVTVHMDDTTHEAIKQMAYWERTSIKEIVNTSLRKTIAEYEKAKGKIKPIP